MDTMILSKRASAFLEVCRNMDYDAKNINSFVHQLALVEKELPKENITKSFISIGSSFFINFGQSKEELLKNGHIYKRSK